MLIILMAIAITVTIAISVTISVAITIASVSSAREVHSIEHYRHSCIFTGSVERLQDRDSPLVEKSCAENEDGHVYLLCYNGGIGNYIDRRTVDEDIVVFLPQVFHHLMETVCKKKLCRVWRQLAHRQDI